MSKQTLLVFFCLLATCSALASATDLSQPKTSSKTVFVEKEGLVAVEAEHFFNQTETKKRAFYLTTKDDLYKASSDGDPPHVGAASNGAYLEILPDTRRNHGEKLIGGENFSNVPGKLAIVHYKIKFQTAGRYYVWVRAHSTGSEDNGLHVGLNGTWPESGQRMQWCEGKRTWRWESKQRTAKEHCGVPHQLFIDIPEPGTHTIHFSMREDGFEFDKFLMTTKRDFTPANSVGPNSANEGPKPPVYAYVDAPNTAPPVVPKPQADHQDNHDRSTSPTKSVSDDPLRLPRQSDGDQSVTLSGEQQQWHKVTFTLDGPYAHEQDNSPNPFLDYRLSVQLTHEKGTFSVPGYFAADGNASETSAESGTKWIAHFAPPHTGTWKYKLTFNKGQNCSIDGDADSTEVFSQTGQLNISASDKTGRDFRGKGRLAYVGKRYLQHQGTGEYFLKAGADAPETLFGYKDFDGTVARKAKVPLKEFATHVGDWNQGDPTWQSGKGKGLIGAINYLSGKGCNAFSFLTYNAGGDGDNVWPFIDRDDKLHYDCSKLDQWGVVMDHATSKGMYLHFKLQETENDDHRKGHKNKQANPFVPTCLDGGNLGPQRKLYIRELVARFGHNLALNWNLGEENTQSTKQQIAMIDYIRQQDPYDHHVVIHTYPDQQNRVYDALIGDRSSLTGASLQNSSIFKTHSDTVKWVNKSETSGRSWVIAFDESGTAQHGQCPDLGYRGFDGKDKTGKQTYDQHAVRRATLWGTLMGGGAGVEYYFGYQYVENDLVCEDWRSRDQSWDYCRIGLEFFRDNKIPFWEMLPADQLIGNENHDNSKYCFAKSGSVYLVYLPKGGSTELDLSDASGKFSIHWFDPRLGGDVFVSGSASVNGGGKVTIDSGKSDGEDWLAVIRKMD
jgi:hypothetical protein